MRNQSPGCRWRTSCSVSSGSGSCPEGGPGSNWVFPGERRRRGRGGKRGLRERSAFSSQPSDKVGEKEIGGYAQQHLQGGSGGSGGQGHQGGHYGGDQFL